jgi:biotin carboxyl carrier protein
MSVNVVSPMPGIITEIFVKAGDKVSIDEDLMILEAMKMENPIPSPIDGVVVSIKVQEKDKVKTDQILAVLEES